MARLVVIGTDLGAQTFEIADEQFADFAEAENAAHRWCDVVIEMAGLLDWKVLLLESGRVRDQWCMDDAQSHYEHGLLIRDNFDAMFYLTRSHK